MLTNITTVVGGEGRTYDLKPTPQGVIVFQGCTQKVPSSLEPLVPFPSEREARVAILEFCEAEA